MTQGRQQRYMQIRLNKIIYLCKLGLRCQQNTFS